MATLDDRILGEKLQYYCSSSEGEDEPEEEDAEDEEGASQGSKSVQDAAVSSQCQDLREWEGTSANTGPKGVLNDWRSYKQMESEKRKEKARERRQMAKKLTLTCRSHLDEEKEKAAKKKAQEEEDVDAMLESAVLEAYIAQRMQEMMSQASIAGNRVFGKIIQLRSAEEFLSSVDNEDKEVTVIVHLYRRDAPGCDAVSGCMACLATEYKSVKFCELEAVTAGLSRKFVDMGVPALLIYREGNLIANFVRLSDMLGEDFYASDLESFLVEHGMLPDKSLVPQSCIRASQQTKDDDSDVSLDD